MDKDETGPERTCIVTRAKRPPEAMIRFVVGPDETVVPDIRRRLPGRGVWVTASAELVKRAASKGAFARGFKAKVRADAALAAEVDAMLERDALGSLAMANKAGAVTTGFAKVEAALGEGKVAALLHAGEAAEDGCRKLDAAARRRGGAEPPPSVKLFSGEQLDLALGRVNVIHAALAAGPAGHAFLGRCRRLTVYRTAAGQDEADAKAASADGIAGNPSTARARTTHLALAKDQDESTYD